MARSSCMTLSNAASASQSPADRSIFTSPQLADILEAILASSEAGGGEADLLRDLPATVRFEPVEATDVS